nr:MBL fold metallo-hydrolase [Eubacterium sp.]
MKVSKHVHLIRKEFNVTPTVKRYINIYLITGKYCYLIDSGVAGSETLIETYLASIGRKITDIKGVFFTHSHPDHIGAAAAIKRLTNCKIYAPAGELPWIENIQQQFAERPIPNFFTLLPESVQVDFPLQDGDAISLEDGLTISALFTPGHSHASMCYLLNDALAFTGDAIPVANDLPIFVDFEKTIESINKLGQLSNIEKYCPAWDNVYNKNEFTNIVNSSKENLYFLKDIAMTVEQEFPQASTQDKLQKILSRSNLLPYAGNPLIVRSIETCCRKKE